MKKRSCFHNAVIVLFLIASTGILSAADTLRVLFFTGKNNHNWKKTTPLVVKALKGSGRFTVDVIDPLKVDLKRLNSYDLIISNWTNFPSKKRVWGAGLEKALIKFVRGGKGFALFHAASACFYDWKEYQDLIGGTWGKNTGHGKIHSFKVSITNKTHPITKGVPDFEITDELWHRLDTRPGINILAKAYSAKDTGGTGNKEPVVLTTKMGKGRGFYIVLGHDSRAVKNIGWQTLMLRGAEWAATGKVTIPVPPNFPAVTDSNGSTCSKRTNTVPHF